MPSATNCPDRWKLQEFVAGLLTEEQAVPLESHLEGCPHCVALLRELPPGDSVTAALLGCAAAKGFPSELESAAARIIGRASTHDYPTVPPTDTPASSDVVMSGSGVGPLRSEADFFDPARGPDELARLGTFRILAKLGEGGMGIVYKAEDTGLRRLVAIKVPRFDKLHLHDSTSRQRFLREARAAAPIRHPNVCPIYSVGEHHGVPYVVMAFVEGHSLAEQLAGRSRQADCHEAVKLARQVAEGLAAVHAAGVIHRDLKPANILLDKSGQAVLTDFGLARPEQDTEHLTAEGSMVGTLAYMPPEQASGERDLDRRADIYSLGVVLYELLAGRLPFQGSATRVMGQMLSRNPPPPSQFRPDLDPALESIVLKAMARELENRYASAEAFADALRVWAPPTGPEVDSESASTETAPIKPFSAEHSLPPTLVHPPRSRQRLWIPATLLGLATLLLLAWLIFSSLNGTLELNVSEVGTVYLDGAKQYVIPAPYHGRIDLRPGEYQFTLKRGEKELHTEPFTVTTGKTVAIRWPTLRPPPTGEPINRGDPLVQRPVTLKGVESWTILPVAVWRERRAVAYSPPAAPRRYLAANLQDSLGLWDLEKREWVRRFFGPPSTDGRFDWLAWSPTGKAIAVGSASQPSWWIWEVPSGKILHVGTDRAPGSIAHPGPDRVPGLAWSPDGKYVAISLAEGGAVKRWAVDERGSLSPLAGLRGSQAEISLLAWNKKGELAFAQQGAVWLCAADADRPTGAFREQEVTHTIVDMAWSPDGKYLACAESNRTVRLWDPASGLHHGPFAGAMDRILGVAWSPDGKRLAAYESSGVTIWDPEAPGKPLRRIDSTGRGPMSWSPDGTTIALGAADSVAEFWDVEKGTSLGNLVDRGGKPIPPWPAPGVAAWSPNGNQLAAGTDLGGSLLLTETHSGESRFARRSDRKTVDLAWSPDGAFLAACSDEGGARVEVVDARSGESAGDILSPMNQTLHLAWAPSSRLAVGGSDNVGIADPDWRKGLKLLGPPRKSHVMALAWSPDGKSLADRDAQNDLHITQIDSDKPPRTQRVAGTSRKNIAWSRDGDLLVVGDGGHLLKVRTWEQIALDRRDPDPALATHWKPEELVPCVVEPKTYLINSSGKVVKVVPDGSSYCVTLSPSGKLLAVVSGTIRIWDTETGLLLRTIVWLPHHWLVLTPEGHYLGPEGVEEEFQVVVRTKDGQELLTPGEFSTRYGWKNDPERVRLVPR
jgi:serine/threonine protein kinase/WD40 repeat protein